MSSQHFSGRHWQRGAAAVEFALIATLFFTLLFGIVEMSRVLFYMNTATEATRLGARLAVVCDVSASVIRTRMVNMLDVLSPENIDVVYQPTGCDIESCQSVTVSIRQGQDGFTINTLIPLVPLNIPMPAFSTTLPRESLNSASNPMCG
ncbi:MAG: TadE/TadG family type IV pilus assembly protein [Noviherbaspirillum sp.]